MAAIYGNSKVTIAAVNARDGDGGCFNDDDKVVSFKHPVSGASMATRKYNSHRQYNHTLNYVTRRSEMPLFARAWTLQEELLAARVLYYGPTEIFFQCRKLVACQCKPIINDSVGNTIKGFYERSRFESTNAQLTLRNWRHVVTQYSSRCLTVETDRLTALSGLAKSFMKPDLGAYLAGMWEKDLHESLTWRSWQPKRARPSVYLAPSWSWASTGSSIIYETDGFPLHKAQDCQSYITILDVACEPSGPDPTGAVRSGHLRIRGRANSAQLTSSEGGGLIHSGPWLIRVNLDFIPPNLELDDPLSTLAVQLLLCSGDRFLGYDGSYYFLILVPAERDGAYERCGIGFGDALHTGNWPKLKIEEGESLLEGAGEYRIEEWFKDVEEQEMTIV